MKNTIKAALVFLLLCCKAALAQEVQVPLDVQSQLVAKSLKYIKNLAMESRTSLTIGIIYQEKNKISADVKEEFLSLFPKYAAATAGNITFELKAIELSSGDLSALQQVDVVYVTPLRAFDIKKIASVCAERQIVTYSAVADYVHEGLLLAFGIENNKPKVLLNLQLAKTLNINILASLVAVSKII